MILLKRVRNIGCIFVISILLVYAAWLRPQYTVPILTYHRFGYEENSLFVTPENFERQISYLKRKQYKVISFDDLVEGIKHHRAFPHNTVVITIDDGYRDSYLYAYPILKKYHFPVIIYLIAGEIDGTKDFLSWQQVLSMRANGISFGAHTVHHVYLPLIQDKEILWNEIAGSKTLIEQKLDAPVDYFCYPTGGFTEEIKELVKKAGYKGACSTNRATPARLNRDIYELKRVKVTNGDTNVPLSFWVKLSGYGNVLKTAKKGS